MKTTILSRIGIQSAFISDRNEIETRLKNAYIRNYEISKDGIVDVADEVSTEFGIFRRNLMTSTGKLKIRFGKVKGFYGYKLASLEGCPKEVENYFYLWVCPKLTSLEGCPKEVNYFNIYDCPKLTSLKGAPEKVRGNCIINKCPLIKSLEGCPSYVGGKLSVDGRWLESLKGAPKKVKGIIEFTTDSNALREELKILYPNNEIAFY